MSSTPPAAATAPSSSPASTATSFGFSNSELPTLFSEEVVHLRNHEIGVVLGGYFQKGKALGDLVFVSN
jgi:hypothetical protein